MTSASDPQSFETADDSAAEGTRTSAEASLHGVPITGHHVLDDHHHKLGTVTDVIYDDRGSARWAVVDPGPLRAEKFVPVEGAYTTAEGDVVVPYDKDQVKAAHKAGREHLVDDTIERQLEEHYQLSSRH